MPEATSVYVGGGTPSRLPADSLAEVLAAVPRAAGAEVTVECNPEDVTAAAAGRLPRRRGHPHLPRRAVDGPRGAGRTGAPRLRACRGGDGGGARCRLRHLERRSHDRGARRERRRLGTEPRGGHRTGVVAAPPERLCADRGAGHRPGRRPGPASRRGRAGRTLRAGRPDAVGRRLPVGGDLELVPPRARVPAQPALLGPGRLPGHRFGGPLPPAAATVGGTSGPPTATWPPSNRGARQSAAGKCSPTRSGASRGSPSGCAPPRGCPPRTFPTIRIWPGWSCVRTVGPSSRCGGGSWPIRSPPGLAAGAGAAARVPTGTLPADA